MLELHAIRESPERARNALLLRGIRNTQIINVVLEADVRRRRLLTSAQNLKAAANRASRAVAELMREGKRNEAEPYVKESARLKEEIRSVEEDARNSEEQVRDLLFDIPNIPHDSVPPGLSADDNVTLHEGGARPTFGFPPLPHWELAAKHSLIDFDRGSKVSGAGFPFYIGKGARLQRALINFWLDLATNTGGYTEIQTPLFVNEASVQGTGQLPDKEGQMYHIGRDNLYPVPTAEVPLTNFYRGDVIAEADLPIKVCGYTPCFRREAGSYGRHVRGLNRLHQFDKVELVQIVRPDRSYEALEVLREDAERAVQSLGLPYRRLLMCAGEMGFNQAKQYDLEVWCAAQGRYLEVSSVSNFTSFQSNRMRIRYRPVEGGKPQLVHTLNGSGLALPRITATILENNQRKDGSIVIPDSLRPYTGFAVIE